MHAFHDARSCVGLSCGLFSRICLHGYGFRRVGVRGHLQVSCQISCWRASVWLLSFISNKGGVGGVEEVWGRDSWWTPRYSSPSGRDSGVLGRDSFDLGPHIYCLLYVFVLFLVAPSLSGPAGWLTVVALASVALLLLCMAFVISYCFLKTMQCNKSHLNVTVILQWQYSSTFL